MSERPDVPGDVVLDVGEQYAVRLGSRATAGYRWHATVEGAAVEVSRSRTADPAAAPGASSDDVFRFSGVTSGAAVVTLELRRPWEVGVAALEVVRVAVRVR